MPALCLQYDSSWLMDAQQVSNRETNPWNIVPQQMVVNVFLEFLRPSLQAYRLFREKNTLYKKHEGEISFIIYNVQLPPKNSGHKGFFVFQFVEHGGCNCKDANQRSCGRPNCIASGKKFRVIGKEGVRRNLENAEESWKECRTCLVGDVWRRKLVEESFVLLFCGSEMCDVHNLHRH